MIGEVGHYALVLALGLALVQSCVPILGARRNDPALMAVAQFAFAAIAFAALIECYVRSDFSLVNVFENSHSAKPLIYKITGVRGNHEGSMLLWVFILSLFGALVQNADSFDLAPKPLAGAQRQPVGFPGLPSRFPRLHPSRRKAAIHRH
jgi:cytochrome c biogenesis factor